MLSHKSFIYEWFVSSYMNHSYMWHDSWAVLCWRFQCFRFVWASLRREGYWIPTKTCNSGRLHNHYQICDMTHSYVWHDSFICVTWLIHIWDMTYSYTWHDSFIYVTWLILSRDKTWHSCCVTPMNKPWHVRHVTHMNEPRLSRMNKSWHTSIGMRHVDGSRHTYEWVMSLTLTR